MNLDDTPSAAEIVSHVLGLIMGTELPQNIRLLDSKARAAVMRTRSADERFVTDAVAHLAECYSTTVTQTGLYELQVAAVVFCRLGDCTNRQLLATVPEPGRH